MLFLAGAIFVGSQPCRGCHTAIADAYSRTPMARSSGVVESAPAAEFTAAGQHYRISGKRLLFDGGSAPLDYSSGRMPMAAATCSSARATSSSCP